MRGQYSKSFTTSEYTSSYPFLQKEKILQHNDMLLYLFNEDSAAYNQPSEVKSVRKITIASFTNNQST